MGRINLSEALKPREDEAAAPSSGAAAGAAASNAVDGPSKASLAAVQKRSAGPSELAAPANGARYLTLERKEARLRSDQFADLTIQARRLNKAKGTGGERITENTLIRVAVDLLMANIDKATGATEDELRDSVTA